MEQKYTRRASTNYFLLMQQTEGNMHLLMDERLLKRVTS